MALETEYKLTLREHTALLVFLIHSFTSVVRFFKAFSISWLDKNVLVLKILDLFDRKQILLENKFNLQYLFQFGLAFYLYVIKSYLDKLLPSNVYMKNYVMVFFQQRRQRELNANPKLRKFWNIIQKKDAAATDEARQKSQFERHFLFNLIQKFFSLLDTILLSGLYYNRYYALHRA